MVLNIDYALESPGSLKKYISAQSSPQTNDISVSGSETQVPVFFKTPQLILIFSVKFVRQERFSKGHMNLLGILLKCRT